ncbi:MAG TPA: HAMP domain-containing histidine kinase [Planctomycetaceae bacterium]|nr:HAMP domain-containing histidine kinase [Planctomycetaceae bacterium]
MRFSNERSSIMNTNLDDLISLNSKQPPLFQDWHVLQLVEEVCDALQSRLGAHNIEVELDIPETTTIWGDATMIRHALFNLVLNAIDAMPATGQLQITSWSGPCGLELEVADSGAGIDTNNCNQLFDATYTTKGEGRGQGLMLVKKVVGLHGGQVSVSNCPQGGAAFTMHLPRQAAQAAA